MGNFYIFKLSIDNWKLDLGSLMICVNDLILWRKEDLEGQFWYT